MRSRTRHPRRCAVAAAVIALLSLPASCRKPQETASPAAGDGVDYQARCQDLLRDDNANAPAREWLTAEGGVPHVLWKGDKETIVRLIGDLEAAGASRVLATGVSRDPNMEVVAMFLAVLPPPGDARTRIFELQRSFWRSYLSDASEEDLKEVLEPDRGQSCLVFNFDL